MAATIERFGDIEQATREAGPVLGRDAEPCLFSRLDWFRLIHRHCPPSGRLDVWRTSEGDTGAWLFLAAKGSSAEAYATYYSLRFDVAGENQPHLLETLARALRPAFARVELEPLVEAGTLAAAFRAGGWRVSIEPATANWRTRIEGDFEDYWAARPSRLRSTAKRRARSADLDIRIFKEFSEKSWSDYEAVYRASWKPEEGSFPFLRALAEQEGAAGTLRLGLAYNQGRPVAAQFWLVENETATIHKLAYAEHAKELSPGTLLSQALFRAAIDEDQVEWIDYGNGDEAYKADWMEERRLLWRLTAYNPARLAGMTGLVRDAARRLARSLFNP
ncbi:MAG: GNAT family N-acetyltransferase [Sphingosinicella sp.]